MTRTISQKMLTYVANGYEDALANLEFTEKEHLNAINSIISYFQKEKAFLVSEMQCTDSSEGQ